MASAHQDGVEDRKGLLKQDDHMRDMDRLQMEVVAVERPFPSVVRVTGRVSPRDPAMWRPANLALRLEVEEVEGERPISRIYTVRAFDEARGLVEIDFVLHADESPAMRWLNAAAPGAKIWMTGPRQHFIPDHASGKKAAVFADETAIPAVYAILKAWPEGAPGAIWIETPDRAAFDELPAIAGVERHLLLRAPEAPAGATGRLLATAKAIAEPALWTLWAAGERQEMRDLRNHFRRLGFAREDLRVFGYWRKGVSSSEIDRMRLQEYEALRDKGLRLEALPDDIDLPV